MEEWDPASNDFVLHRNIVAGERAHRLTLSAHRVKSIIVWIAWQCLTCAKDS